MKKVCYIIILVILVLIFDNCYAFSKQYDYNYGITDFYFNGTSGRIDGWAILNAGINDSSNENGLKTHSSPNVRRSWGSRNGYNYELIFYGLDKNDNVVSSKIYSQRGHSIDLTYTMCDKKNDLSSHWCTRPEEPEWRCCIMDNSSYYKNVGFNFYFYINDLSNLSKVSKYKFELRVTSNDGVSKKFGLSFLEKYIESGADDYHDNSENFMEYVRYVANEAGFNASDGTRYVICDDFNAGSSKYDCDSGSSNTGKKFEIKGTKVENGIIYYKLTMNVSAKGGSLKKYTDWVPSSWVVPYETTTILVDPKESCDVDGKKFSFAGSKNNPLTDSCENNVSLTSSKNGSCVTPQTNKKFYEFTCQDYMEVEFIPSKAKYYRGDKFEIDVKVTLYAKCNGTFNVSLYNSVDARKYDKEVIKNNFLNFKLNNYGTTPTGYMNVYGRNVDLKITNTSTTSFEDKDTSYSGSVPSSMTYTTNKRVITMKLKNEVIVDRTRENIPYKIYVNNLGYSGNSQAIFDCEIEKILEFYRSVDPKDPFVSLSGREIGENWKNSKYDFVDIIKADIWTETPAYIFNISTENVKSIKRSNSLLGANAYIGSECNVLNNRRYCPFIRSHDYFSKIYIYGVQQ